MGVMDILGGVGKLVKNRLEESKIGRAAQGVASMLPKNPAKQGPANTYAGPDSIYDASEGEHASCSSVEQHRMMRRKRVDTKYGK